MKTGNKRVMNCVVGNILTILITLIFTALFSKIMIKHIIKDSIVEIVLSIVLFLGTYVGNTITLRGCTNKYLVFSIINGSCVLLVMLLTAMNMEGEFRNVFYRVITVTGGIVTSIIINQKYVIKRNMRKSRYC